MFSINLHEVQNRKNILKSEAWDYMLKINPRPFVDAPYWYTLPHSFSSILIADTFSDYYNLFNHVDNLNTLPANQKIETENGRYTTLALIQSMLWANRFGLALVLIWIFGGIGWLIASLRKKKFDKYRVYLFFLAACGICALAYNNLRYPYLDRGVLKSQFIFFTLPLISLISLYGWKQILRKNMLFISLVALFIILYTIKAWPILNISP